MPKKEELDAALTALSELSNTMLEKIQRVYDLISASMETDQPATAAPKAYTIEEVRALLLKKRRDGFRDEIKALLSTHGAERLTDIDPGEYAAMMQEAEAIGA